MKVSMTRLKRFFSVLLSFSILAMETKFRFLAVGVYFEGLCMVSDDSKTLEN
jgi:hypothetical protein